MFQILAKNEKFANKGRGISTLANGQSHSNCMFDKQTCWTFFSVSSNCSSSLSKFFNSSLLRARIWPSPAGISGSAFILYIFARKISATPKIKHLAEEPNQRFVDLREINKNAYCVIFLRNESRECVRVCVYKHAYQFHTKILFHFYYFVCFRKSKHNVFQ